MVYIFAVAEEILRSIGGINLGHLSPDCNALTVAASPAEAFGTFLSALPAGQGPLPVLCFTRFLCCAVRLIVPGPTY